MLRSPKADLAAPWLRRGLLWVAALTTAGTGIELAVERHWTQPVQFVGWGAIGLLALALALLVRAPSWARIRLAQIIAAAVLFCAAWGVWEHVYSNYDAGPLDYRYGETWDSLSEASRWWLAVTKTVGPSPPLAPGALAQASLCVLLATLRHPRLASSTDEDT